jgi:hypothetical protein
LAELMITNGYFNGESVRLDGAIRMAPDCLVAPPALVDIAVETARIITPQLGSRCMKRLRRKDADEVSGSIWLREEWTRTRYVREFRRTGTASLTRRQDKNETKID